MRVRSVLAAVMLGLGLVVALLCVLGSSILPGVRATTISDIDTTDDDVASNGNCTLREAIQAADTDSAVDGCSAGVGDDTVVVPAGIYTLTLTSASYDRDYGDLDVSSSDALTITGAGACSTTINANGIDRVVHIDSGAGTVVISGVTILGGRVSGSYGGGIYDSGGGLVLINTIVRDNWSSSNGGGVHLATGELTLTGGQVISNFGGVGGGVWAGGAVTVTISDAQLVSNTASLFGGGVYLSGGSATLNAVLLARNTALNGGALYVQGGTPILNGGQITSNVALAEGGGVFVYGGSPTLGAVEVVSNTAQSGGGLYAFGGGAWLNGTRLISNTASDRGGGLYVAYDASATLQRAQVVGNTATNHGGGGANYEGTLTLVNTTVSGNYAGTWGGGLHHHHGTTVLTFTTVASNTASSEGSGVYFFDVGSFLVQGSLFAHNGCNTGLHSSDYNLQDGNSCGFTASHDMTNTDPLLGQLTDDGGTLIHPLLEGSQGIDNGLCVGGITADQRGVSRPYGLTCDIGAYEYAQPVARAGPDQSVNRAAPVTLDGSGSSDPGGDLSLAYHWAQTGGPAVAFTPGLSVTTFTAPSHLAVLTFTLAVTDSLGVPDPTADEVVITVANQPPSADAGADQSLSTNATVTLDGTGSSDPDGDLPLIHWWTQTGGPAVTFSPHLCVTTFMAPSYSAVLTFTLAVTDSLGLPDPTPDEVVIAVEPYRVYLPLVLRNY